MLFRSEMVESSALRWGSDARSSFAVHQCPNCSSKGNGEVTRWRDLCAAYAAESTELIRSESAPDQADIDLCMPGETTVDRNAAESAPDPRRWGNPLNSSTNSVRTLVNGERNRDGRASDPQRSADDSTATSSPHSRTLLAAHSSRRNDCGVHSIPCTCTGIFGATSAQCRGHCPAAVPEVTNDVTEMDLAI